MSEIEADFSLNELLAVLREHDQSPDGFYRMTQWATWAGVGQRKIRNIMWALKRAGYLEVSRVRTEDLTGRMIHVPAYRIRLPAKSDNTAPAA